VVKNLIYSIQTSEIIIAGMHLMVFVLNLSIRFNLFTILIKIEVNAIFGSKALSVVIFEILYSFFIAREQALLTRADSLLGRNEVSLAIQIGFIQ